MFPIIQNFIQISSIFTHRSKKVISEHVFREQFAVRSLWSKLIINQTFQISISISIINFVQMKYFTIARSALNEMVMTGGMILCIQYQRYTTFGKNPELRPFDSPLWADQDSAFCFIISAQHSTFCSPNDIDVFLIFCVHPLRSVHFIHIVLFSVDFVIFSGR